MQIGILEGDRFSAKALRMLSNAGDIDIYTGGSLGDFLSDKEALFIRLNYQIDGSFLENSHNLRYLCSPTTGHNHIDEKALLQKGVDLISLRGEAEFLSCIRATPEHTFGLVLGLLRNYPHAFLNKHNMVWDRDKYRGYELYNNTVGIIGMGRVGKILTNYMNTFGAKVFYFDIDSSVESEAAERCDSIISLIAKSNIVLLCASYSEKCGKIINSKEIQLMHGKYFVNTARGELVDEDSLLDSIRNKEMAGVAIDVIDNECGNNQLDRWLDVAEIENVIVTPHISGATYSSMHATEEFIAEKLLGVISQDEKKN